MAFTNSPEVPGGWIAQRWGVVRGVIAAVAALCFAAAILLFPPVAARFLSTDGQLTASSQRSLYLLVAGLVGMGLVAMLLRRTWRTPTPSTPSR